MANIKTGDTVRFLNAVGGGIVRRIEGKIAYVDEDGFETPVLTNELVVVLPAGHESPKSGPKLFFDQKAVDAVKHRQDTPSKEIPAPTPVSSKAPQEKIPETPYGDRLNIALAFEPSAIRTLDKSDFNAVLVNDSNYYLLFSFLRRGADERGWTSLFAGEAAPNELVDLAILRSGELNDFDKVALQYVAIKKDKPFEMKPPAFISKKLDLTKFFKLHCFRPGIYFDTPVMELQLIKEDRLQADSSVMMADFAAKAAADKPKSKKPERGRELSPYKLLPLIEIDLHIDQLLDTTAGMQPKDMLTMQLDTVRHTMAQHSKRKGQKIVFIHGKGDGVLRKAVRDLLHREYPKADLQDASFQQYGFGATLVTI